MRQTGNSVVGVAVAIVLVAMACGATPEPSATEGAAAANEPVTIDPVPVPDLLPNAIEVEEGLLAGGQPSVEQLAALKEAGYVTVINLRTDGEGGTGQAEVEAAGMTYVTLPVAGAEGLSVENARNLGVLLADVERPAVVHCGSGNRVGGLLALKAFYVDGSSAEEALQYGLDSGLTSLEDSVREHLEQASSGPE